MSESLLSMLKKKKEPVKKKKIGVKIPKKGEIAVETTLIDKTKDGRDMSNFRERLKLNKNKSYKSLVNESQTKSVDRDLMSRPQTIPELERVDLSEDLSVIAEEGEEKSVVNTLNTDDVDRDVEDISSPFESKVSKTKKPSKIKSKMTLPGNVEGNIKSSNLKKTKKTKKPVQKDK